MTRDYKPAPRARKAPSSGSASSLMVGILIGLLLGLGIAVGVAVYLNKVPSPFVERTKPADPAAKAPGTVLSSRTPSEPAADKPRFDFYTILPGTDDAAKAKERPDAPERAPSKAVAESFYLQAGAFHSEADADNLRARMALLGVEAAIQTTATTDKGTLHRVRVGPFTRVEDVTRIRDTLKQNGIDTTLIKARTG